MKKTVLVAALVGTAAIAFAKGPQKPGMYHLTVQMEMAGMGQMPPMAFDRCITKDEADDPAKTVKAQSRNCDPADVKVEGNHVTYKISCHEHGGTQTGTGEMTYAGDGMTGTVSMEMANPRGGGTIKMTQHMTAQRTGDCK
ncbi:MAG TPA: DUF3617 family protein [Polyangia bacterium]|jgi:hypothetical protein